MAATVSDIVHVLNKLVPQTLAEEWDNVGLQIGDPKWPVQTIWISLDPTPQVVEAACRKNVELLVTHHPLFFKPLKSINFNTALGSIIDLATTHQLAIFAAHTNLDSVTGGINDIIARRIGLSDLKPLVPIQDHKHFKLVVYAPQALEQRISRLLLQSRSATGQGTYRSFRSTGRRAFVNPSKGISNNGIPDNVSQMDEIRIEIDLDNAQLTTVVEALAGSHRNEPVWYDLYPLVSHEMRQGVGRVGRLDTVMELRSLALMIKRNLGLQGLKFAGDPALPVKKVALCSGSGSGLLSNFLTCGAQAYVSGDMRYHDARDAEAAHLGIIDIGHFPSEHLIVDVLADRLKTALAEDQINVTVEACELEKDPFMGL